VDLIGVSGGVRVVVVVLCWVMELVGGEGCPSRVKESEHLQDILWYDCDDVWVHEMARTRE
jgi:hypothetical protein